MRYIKLRKYYTPAKLFLYLVLGFIFVIVASNLIVVISSSKYLYDKPENVPHENVALVLGTSRYLKGGAPNQFFHNRILAAAELYKAGRVNYIILSGDNRTRYYNEPLQMRLELLKHGVPDSLIYLDYAGLRTLDSVVRCSEIFGQNSFVVVSQKFHNQRAVFLGRARGLSVTGFNAADVDSHSSLKTRVREYFARVKALMDLISRKGPRHLGDPIIIGN